MKRLAVLAIAFSLVAPVYAAPNTVTVGDFVQELARVKQLNAGDARIAVDALAAAGVRLPADIDLDKQLTESDVTRLSRLVGLKVTSSNPDRVFSEDQVEQFFVAFGSDLTEGIDDDLEAASNEGNNGNGPGFNPYTKGKGGSKGKKKGFGGPISPTEPE